MTAVLTFIAEAIAGLALLTGLVIGAVFVIAREISKGAAHDQARCQCVDCKRRRVEASEKAKARGRYEPVPIQKRTRAKGWLSTEELMTGMRIEAKDTTYEVINLLVTIGLGTQVHLNNMTTGLKSMVLVRRERASLRIWKRVD
jgi:hypothetical protein